MYDFLIETALSFIPPADSIAIEQVKNFRGIQFLLGRTFYSGVTGHVRDSVTQQPLEAKIEVIGLMGDSIDPRSSDVQFGRFYRLLLNGTYAFRFSKQGYVTKTVYDVPVTSDSLTHLDILLTPETGIDRKVSADDVALPFMISPNPFRDQCSITTGQWNEETQMIRIYDVTGRCVKRLVHPTSYSLLRTVFSWDGTDDTGNQLESGVYFINVSERNTPGAVSIIKIR
jgi:hypothetical protein